MPQAGASGRLRPFRHHGRPVVEAEPGDGLTKEFRPGLTAVEEHPPDGGMGERQRQTGQSATATEVQRVLDGKAGKGRRQLQGSPDVLVYATRAEVTAALPFL